MMSTYHDCQEQRCPSKIRAYREPKTGDFRPKQKNMFWMKDKVQKFSRREDLMMDFRADKYSTASALKLPEQHRTFVKLDVGS